MRPRASGRTPPTLLDERQATGGVGEEERGRHAGGVAVRALVPHVEAGSLPVSLPTVTAAPDDHSAAPRSRHAFRRGMNRRTMRFMRRKRSATGDRSEERKSKRLARFAARRAELDSKVRAAQAEIEAKERIRREEERRALAERGDLDRAFQNAMDREE